MGFISSALSLVLHKDAKIDFTGRYTARTFDLSHFHPSCPEVRFLGSVEGVYIACFDCRAIAAVEAVGRRVGWAEVCTIEASRSAALGQLSPGIEQLHARVAGQPKEVAPWAPDQLPSSAASPQTPQTSLPEPTSRTRLAPAGSNSGALQSQPTAS